jgi:biopolymer transport protein ExbB/TolQ
MLINEFFKAFTLIGANWVMYLLIVLSVVSVAVLIVRGIELKRLERRSLAFWADHARQWVETGDVSSWKKNAEKTAAQYGSIETDICRLLLAADKQDIGDYSKIIEGYLEHRKGRLEKSISVLGTIGANATFIGLLGTVLGIIKAFHDLAGASEGGATAGISSGIAEALVATAVGLLVAIPAVVFFNYLKRKVTKLMNRAFAFSSFLLGSKQYSK